MTLDAKHPPPGEGRRGAGGIRLAIAALFGVVVGLLVADVGGDGAPASTPAPLAPDPKGDVHVVAVRPADDVGQPGSVQGVMGQKYFDHDGGRGGPSEDLLRFEFAAPARIHQVHVSVDMTDDRAWLVEYLVGRNTGRYSDADRPGVPLGHVSWTRSTPSGGQIDETIPLPEGVEVEAGDTIDVGAWTSGPQRFRTSPEVVVLYEWL